jgi:hypothetical protein
LEEKTAIYTFKTKDGQVRKAIDLLALNNFIDSRLLNSNPIMNDELNKTTIEDYRGKISWGILMELNIQVKRDLGLIQEQSEEPNQPETDEPETVNEPEPPKPAPKKVQEKDPKQEVEDMLTKNQDDDDVIVLD